MYFNTLLRSSIARAGSSVHDCFPEFENQLILQRFGKEISLHVAYRTVFNRQFILGDLIFDEVVSNVDMLGTPTAGHLAMFLKQDCTLIILV
jgi:hypothetical protein